VASRFSKSVSLVGAGAAQTTISGGGPVLTIALTASVTIRGVTISGGDTADSGGGISNGGTLTR